MSMLDVAVLDVAEVDARPTTRSSTDVALKYLIASGASPWPVGRIGTEGVIRHLGDHGGSRSYGLRFAALTRPACLVQGVLGGQVPARPRFAIANPDLYDYLISRHH